MSLTTRELSVTDRPSVTVEPFTGVGPPADAAALADLCRLTVFVGRTRADLAVPASLTPGTLIPVIIQRLTRAHRSEQESAATHGWVMQRIGDPPLDENVALDVAGIVDGDELYLRPAEAALPEVHFDDLAEGIAEAVSGRGDRWTPAATQVMLLVVAGLALAATILTVAVIVPPALLTPVGVGAAVVAVGVSVLLARRAGQRVAAVFVGSAGAVLAALAGLAVSPVPGLGTLLTGSVLVLLVSVAVLVGARVAPTTFGALSAGAVATTLMGLCSLGGMSAPGAAATVAVVCALIGATAPRMSLRLAGLRVPLLPRSAEELGEDIEPATRRSVFGRTARAEAIMTVLSIVVGVTVVIAATELRTDLGWASQVLGGLLVLCVTLRARGLLAIGQRASLVGSGALAGALLLTGAVAVGPTTALILLAVAVIALVLALVASWKLPGNRVLPIWGQISDVVELLSALALVPILLQLLGVYAMFRGMNG